MALFDIINRAERIHRLIRNESTGTPCEFAKRFNLSRRQLYNLLEEFRDFGAEIKYDRNKQSFYYMNNFQLELIIKVVPIDVNKKTTIYGDKNEKKISSAIWLHGVA